MAILVGITPSGRPEGFLLIALAAVALVAHRRWYYVFVLPIPLALWSYLGWVSWDRPGDLPWYLWLKRNWPYAAQSAYGSGPWYHFIMLLPVLVSPLMFPMLLPGIVRSIRAGLGRVWATPEPGLHAGDGTTLEYAQPGTYRGLAFFADHAARCQFLIAFIPLTILVVHSVLWRFGLMASNGELRYLLAVAPLWALLGAKGWEWAWARFRLPAPFLCAAIAAAAPAAANRYYKVIPLRLYAEDYMCRAAAEWYTKTPTVLADFPRLTASLPGVWFAVDRSPSNKKVALRWGLKTAQEVPPGVVMFWDPVYAERNADRNLIVYKQAVIDAGWLPIGRVTYEDKWCDVYLSPRTASGEPTDPKRYPLPEVVKP
jgi:hypothetical protein